MESPLPVLTMPSVGGIDLSFMASMPILVVIFVAFGILYFIVTTVLMYHWSAYGMRSAGIMAARTLFLFVSVVLFSTAALALSYY